MQDYELRQQFAIHCPQNWVDRRMPKTVGDIRDLMVKRGIIPKSRQEMHTNTFGSSYTDAEYNQLEVLIRWDYADAMMKPYTESNNEGY